MTQTISAGATNATESASTTKRVCFFNGTDSDIHRVFIIHQLATGTKRGLIIDKTIEPGKYESVPEIEYDSGNQKVEVYFMLNRILHKTTRQLVANWWNFSGQPEVWLNLYINNINISCDGVSPQDQCNWSPA